MLRNKIIENPQPLPREFYLRDTVTVAYELLGKRLIYRRFINHNSVSKSKNIVSGITETTSGIIIETEAYTGWNDKACHSYKRESPHLKHRTNIMFSEGGLAYVYLIYGMYNCFNVVANVCGNPEAVLIRAIEPEEGIDIMQKRRLKLSNRNTDTDKNTDTDTDTDKIDIKHLCNGPGKLCISMGITRNDYGKDLCGNELFITEGININPNKICTTPRINVDYAEDDAKLPYRFVIRDNPYISTRKFIK
ncbi:MAG: DNA-3-methyladenine glycosylase [Planctomycetaceae bacterium]|jgi:DNA-3-methyladenine glycosylase|nr:DNA-3-methyladenine glycosylase [Planctomycetaceae bacterium]